MKHYRIFLLLILAAMMVAPAAGQTPYKLPPKDVVAILDAPPPPLAIVSPTRDALLLVEIQPYPSIESLAEPILRLAGLRINPRVGGSQRTIHYTGLTIQPLDGSPARRVALPEGASIHSPSWSHDGKKIAFARDVDDGVELWVADAATGQAKPIAGARLNDVLADPITWLSDNRHILAVLVPEGRGPAPAAPRAPARPQRAGKLGPPEPDGHVPGHAHQPARRRPLPALRDRPACPDRHRDRPDRADRPGRPDHRRRALARREIPAGQHGPPAVLVSRAVRLLHAQDRGLGRRAAGRSPRSPTCRSPTTFLARACRPALGAYSWQPLHDARLIWTEALDGGDPRKKVAHRDKVMSLDGPIHRQARRGDGSPASLLGLRLAAGEGPASSPREFDRDRRWRTTSLVDLTKPDESRKVLFDLSINDAYEDPGVPVTVTRPDGVRTILQDGDSIYLVGQGASPEGSRPFLDKMDLKTGEKTRLFQCARADLRVGARLRGRLALDDPHQPRDEDRAAQRLHRRSRDRQADEAHRLPRPRPAAHRPQERADQVQARRRRPALGHALPAARLQGRHAAAPDHLGLSPRVQRRRHGRPGAHVALHVHPADGPVAVVLRHPGLCRAR